MSLSGQQNEKAYGGEVSLLRLMTCNVRLLVTVPVVFALLALVLTLARGRMFEATAFVEADQLIEVETVAQRLRFPSVYFQATGSEAKAEALAERTRVKVVRDSRIVAVSVRDKNAQTAADLANLLVEPDASVIHREAFNVSSTAVAEGAIDGEDAIDGLVIPPAPTQQQAAPVSSREPLRGYQVVERALVPQKPAGTPMPLLWLSAALAGLFCAMVWLLLREEWRSQTIAE